MNTVDLPLGLIDPPPTAHRLSMDEAELAELSASIRSLGLINPIRVAPAGERYHIIAGHRRFLAVQQLGRDTIAAVIDRTDDRQQLAGKQLAENFHRSDLSPIEEARALAIAQRELELDITRLAALTKKRTAWIEARLALLALPDDLGPLVHTRKLAIAAAHALARCTDLAHRTFLADYTISSGASASVITEWVNAWRTSQQTNPAAPPPAPTLPLDGQRPVIQLPCWICQTAHDHTRMAIVRVCASCHSLPRPETSQ